MNRAVLALILWSAFLASCGGGDGSNPSPSGPPSPPPVPVPVPVPVPPPVADFTTFQSATIVLGQPNFEQGAPSTNPARLSGPIGPVAAAVDGTIFVADAANGRVLGYESIATGATATISLQVLGTASFVSVGQGLLIVGYQNNVRFYQLPVQSTSTPVLELSGDGGCGRNLREPQAALITDDGKLIISDMGNHRVLIWDQVPTTIQTPANLVLGQPDEDHCLANQARIDPGAGTLSSPTGIWSDGSKLIVADMDNSRVLIWTEFPTPESKDARIVLGQPGVTSGHSNIGGTTASESTLSFPVSISAQGNKLAVADMGNNRVLIWDEFPSDHFAEATTVIGQETFVRREANDDDQEDGGLITVTGRVLHTPMGVRLHGAQLFVTDRGNNRVLVFQGD